MVMIKKCLSNENKVSEIQPLIAEQRDNIQHSENHLQVIGLLRHSGKDIWFNQV